MNKGFWVRNRRHYPLNGRTGILLFVHLEAYATRTFLHMNSPVHRGMNSVLFPEMAGRARPTQGILAGGARPMQVFAAKFP